MGKFEITKKKLYEQTTNKCVSSKTSINLISYPLYVSMYLHKLYIFCDKNYV